MNDTQLRCFLIAAHYQNFSQAARECHMTQPTVSRQIATLENEIGTPLFERRGKRLALTPAGKYLAEIIQSYADQRERLLAECRRMGIKSHAALKVRTGPWENFLIQKPLADFARTAGSQGEFSCSSNSYATLSNKLHGGNLTLAFGIEHCARRTHPDLITVPVYRRPWLVAAAVTHAFWDLPADRRSLLEGQTVILSNRWLESPATVLGQSEELGPFEPDCLRQGLRQSGVIHGGILYSQLAMARAGYGVLIVPPWLPEYLLEGLRTEDCLAVPYAPTIVMVENPNLRHPHLPLLKQLCLDHFQALGTLE